MRGLIDALLLQLILWLEDLLLLLDLHLRNVGEITRLLLLLLLLLRSDLLVSTLHSGCVYGSILIVELSVDGVLGSLLHAHALVVHLVVVLGLGLIHLILIIREFVLHLVGGSGLLEDGSGEVDGH